MDIEGVVQDLRTLLADLDLSAKWTPSRYDDVRRWSFGDVENNGVYYHPQLTHYAHQVFEQFFFDNTGGLHYADLSGRDPSHQVARQKHSPPIQHRMTFPVEWLHQWMLKPMRAGDVFQTWIDTHDLAGNRIGVRAHVYDAGGSVVAVVIWVRWARVLEPDPKTVEIPEWFPRRRRANITSSPSR
jgi:acyl-CoA thioesterase FadM